MYRLLICSKTVISMIVSSNPRVNGGNCMVKSPTQINSCTCISKHFMWRAKVAQCSLLRIRHTRHTDTQHAVQLINPEFCLISRKPSSATLTPSRIYSPNNLTGINTKEDPMPGGQKKAKEVFSQCI